jgi:enamine deaminase RidA (YjgF/YER057c/UK114 family)
MPTFFNPPTVHPAAPSYSHGALHGLHGRRLVISGQIGMAPDGTIPASLEAQIAQAFDNLVAVLRAGDMDIANLVKIVTYVTVPDAIGAFRTVRQAKLGDHRCAATFLQISALVRPELLVEIEGEAVSD